MPAKLLLTWDSITLSRLSCSFNPLRYLDKLSTLWKQKWRAEWKGKASDEILNRKKRVTYYVFNPLLAVLCCWDIPEPPKSFIFFKGSCKYLLKRAAFLSYLSHAYRPRAPHIFIQIKAAAQSLLLWKLRTAEKSHRSSSVFLVLYWSIYAECKLILAWKFMP